MIFDSDPLFRLILHRLSGSYGTPIGQNPTYQPPSPVPAPRGFVPQPVLNPISRVPGPLPIGGLGSGPNQPAQQVNGITSPDPYGNGGAGPLRPPVVSPDPYGGGGHGPILRSLLSYLHG